jgi:hypothetical protein
MVVDMHVRWLLVALLSTASLAGCQDGKGESANLVLDHLTSSSPSPISIPVNVTDRDRETYPVLDKLFSKWEAGRGTYAGFSEPYPYEDGLRLIHDLQAREPAGYYRAGTVRLSYQGELFDLGAARSVVD